MKREEVEARVKQLMDEQQQIGFRMSQIQAEANQLNALFQQKAGAIAELQEWLKPAVPIEEVLGGQIGS